MALPYNAPTLPRIARPATRGATVPAAAPALLRRVREIATSPMTALVVMVLGLAGLFLVPMIGLPFVAVVVLPAVVYQLRAEQRQNLRRPRR